MQGAALHPPAFEKAGAKLYYGVIGAWVDSFDVPVLAYGLKNDFRNELFEGSYYMLVYADKIEEIKTICWCGKKATMVARVKDGKCIKSGDQIMVGGDDMYVSLCRKHYNEGRLKPDKG